MQTGKHLCQNFKKVAGRRPAFLLKKKLWHGCFSVNFPKLQRTPFSQNTSGRLLLNESDVAPKQIKSLYRVFRDMIFLLLEDMQEEKVKDIVKLDVHQLIEKGKYRGFSSI